MKVVIRDYLFTRSISQGVLFDNKHGKQTRNVFGTADKSQLDNNLVIAKLGVHLEFFRRLLHRHAMLHQLPQNRFCLFCVFGDPERKIERIPFCVPGVLNL